MQRMLTDTELRHRVIPAACQAVAEGFDNRRLIQDLAEVYRSEGIGPEDRGQKTEDRRQRTEGRGQIERRTSNVEH